MLKLADLKVIFEDNHLIAVDKPAGYLVHGDGSDAPVLSDLVKAYIKERYDKPGDVFLGVIHRIDQPVTGVVVFARTSKALERMNEMFRDRKITKIYWALTEHIPPEDEGTLRHWLLKDTKINKVKAWDAPPAKFKDKVKEAVLHYKLKMNLSGLSLIEVNLETGRPHQIRVQLSAAGFPIRYDSKYGAAKKSKNTSIALHCHAIQFEHPVKKTKVDIRSYPPKRNGWELFQIDKY